MPGPRIQRNVKGEGEEENRGEGRGRLEEGLRGRDRKREVGEEKGAWGRKH